MRQQPGGVPERPSYDEAQFHAEFEAWKKKSREDAAAAVRRAAAEERVDTYNDHLLGAIDDEINCASYFFDNFPSKLPGGGFREFMSDTKKKTPSFTMPEDLTHLLSDLDAEIKTLKFPAKELRGLANIRPGHEITKKQLTALKRLYIRMRQKGFSHEDLTF